MIIARFGATWAGATALPTAMMEDDYGPDRPPLANPVGGLDGEFDHSGEDANPIAPVLVRKSFVVTATTWAGVETALDTLRAALLGGGESKLWGEMRDGTHRWAWAKCTEFGAPDRVGQMLHCPVEIAFELSEGLWYSETEHYLNLPGAGTTVINHAGNVPAILRATTGVTAAISSTTIANSTNGSGYTIDTSALGDAGFDIDPADYSCMQYLGATDYFDLLTPAQPGRLWLTLAPGNNSIVTSSVGGASSGWNSYWYDTWVM